jgi:hypothetical protein
MDYPFGLEAKSGFGLDFQNQGSLRRIVPKSLLLVHGSASGTESGSFHRFIALLSSGKDAGPCRFPLVLL